MSLILYTCTVHSVSCAPGWWWCWVVCTVHNVNWSIRRSTTVQVYTKQRYQMELRRVVLWEHIGHGCDFLCLYIFSFPEENEEDKFGLINIASPLLFQNTQYMLNTDYHHNLINLMPWQIHTKINLYLVNTFFLHQRYLDITRLVGGV